MSEALAAFHFLRPWWLLAVPLMVVLWWAIRPHGQAEATPQEGVAAHLAEAMSLGQSQHRRVFAIDGVLAMLVLLALATAGPAWQRVPDPLVAQTAPLVVALKVAGSMAEADLAPSRLEQAKFKILDLVARRAGARTALVAYSGTAHRVAPLTEDPGILRALLEGLTPDVMPVTGDDPAAALGLAQEILDSAEVPGAILFVTDDLPPDSVAAFDGAAVTFLVAAPASVPVVAIDRLDGAVRLSADDTDLNRIERRIEGAYRDALQGDDSLKWRDRGGLLAWPAAILALIWFRRGWTMRWALGLVVLIGPMAPTSARADGLADWFWTPDQQGQQAYDDRRFGEAATLFQDPFLKAHAMLKAGQYPEAAEALAALTTPEAAFAEGLARIRNREYRPAIAAYETALERRPDFPEAARNLEIARAALTYVEETREQSDTGEEAGIGADDVVFDNDEAKGVTTQIDAPQDGDGVQSAEQWMRTVDTQMGDFLKSRFLLENARRDP